MKVIKTALEVLILTLVVVFQSMSVAQGPTKADRAIEAVKQLCLTGTQYDLRTDAQGNLTLLKPGAAGSVSVNVRRSSGAAAIFDNKLRREADEDIRNCIKPHIPEIIRAILQDDPVEPTSYPPPPTACPTSDPINMVGRVASYIPGTPLQLCQAVTSVIDRDTRPVDFYSVQLQAGQSVRFRIQCTPNCELRLWNPNTRPANPLSAVVRVWSSRNREDSEEYTAAVGGTYPVSITAKRSSVRYTASVQPVE